MLTPKQMLHKGIFGGTYFAELVDYKNFPDDWFYKLNKQEIQYQREQMEIYSYIFILISSILIFTGEAFELFG